jgi:hypothetical protein
MMTGGDAEGRPSLSSGSIRQQLEEHLFDSAQAVESIDPKRMKPDNPQEDMIRFQKDMMQNMQMTMRQMMEMQRMQQESMMKFIAMQQPGGTHREAPQGDEAPQPDAVSGVVADEEDPLNDQEIDRKFHQCKQKFGKKVRAYMKSVDLQRRRADDAQLMREDAKWEKYPKGTKPYKASPSEFELDDEWSKTAYNALDVVITIAKGTSRRRAIEGLHHQVMKWQTEIYLESASAKVSNLHTASRKSMLQDACKNVITEAFSDAGTEGLGLEAPRRVKPNDDAIASKVEKLYLEIVEKVRAEKKEEDKKRGEEEERQKVRDEELVNAKPELLLQEFVDDRVRRLAGDDEFGDMEDGSAGKDDNEDEAIEKSKRLVDALNTTRKSKKGCTKDGKPPPWEGGPKSWKSSKGKGKGKGKGGPKGDWNTWNSTPKKPKGKGKGDGKGWKGDGSGGKKGGKAGR